MYTSHIVRSTSTINNTHLRYNNSAKCPRALVPFFVAVANVACSCCLLQIVSTCIGPYRLAQQTQVLQEGHFTPYDHAFTLQQQMHTEPVEMLTIWLVSPRNWPRNRPRDVRFRFRFFFGFFSKTDRNRPTFWWETEKTPRAIFYFRSQPLNILRTYAALTALICSGSILRTMAECYSYLRD